MHDENETPQIVSVIDPDGIDCVLAAGDASDLPAIRTWLAGLSETAYGRVFIEVFSPIQIEPLDLPEHVGATWICRETLVDETQQGAHPERGTALARAVEAWFAEWLWADSDSPRNFQLWTGARTCVAMQAYWASLDARIEKRWPALREHARQLS